MVDNSSKCIFVLISKLGRVKNISYSSCSKMAATRKKNWRQLHENEVIRASLGGIRITEFNCHFSSLSNSFSSPQNMQNSKETTLGPYDLIFVQLAPVFSEWRPFLNKVYAGTLFEINILYKPHLYKLRIKIAAIWLQFGATLFLCVSVLGHRPAGFERACATSFVTLDDIDSRLFDSDRENLGTSWISDYRQETIT